MQSMENYPPQTKKLAAPKAISSENLEIESCSVDPLLPLTI
jgi:hypothetical protein